LQSYELAQELNIKKIIKESSLQLAEIHAFQGNYKKAFEYHKIYDTVKDSLFNQENLRQLSDMQAKYEAQTKEQEINRLKIEQYAKNGEIKQKTIFTYALVAILLLSLFFSGLVFYNYQAKQKVNTALEIKNTELNETLAQLKNTQSQLIHSEKMASLGQLTAGIAHEINNPLNFVYAGISALEHCLTGFFEITDAFRQVIKETDKEKIIDSISELQKNDAAKEYEEAKMDINSLVKDIKMGAVRTTDIVKGLRNFSRFDEGVPKYGDIHNDLDAAIMLLRAKLIKDITVSKKYGDKIPEIAALHGQLNQVFTNIIANAVQAMEYGGKLTILTKTVLINGKNHVSISIKDTGTGMPKQVKDKIFEPFFTTKDIGEGTGLGLSISYGIIQKHRGNIEVFTEVGKGTEFVITLPVEIS
jgi:two-component system, NtrC family, sensor kinase